MKQLVFAAFLTACGAGAFAAAPEISNVRAEQRAGTKLIDIWYDAADAGSDTLKVRIELSDNAGASYAVPAVSFDGDVGAGVEPGLDRHVVWNAGADWDGEYSDQMRVKIIAVNNDGFPGMAWSDPIPAGGFLMGQDGGAEGSGPSKHINIPWSYKLGRTEVTVGEYCDFLNMANAAGFLDRRGYDSVWLSADSKLIDGATIPLPLVPIGDDRDLRWNVVRYEVVGGRTNLPVRVTWSGALAFARFYGCDLPTDAEWEKAARGPDNGAFGTHCLYPWGNDLDGTRANYLASGDAFEPDRTPVGSYPTTGYGLCDMGGNLAEWTLTDATVDMETDYPAEEALSASCHTLSFREEVSGDNGDTNRLFVSVRGGSHADSDIQLYVRSPAKSGLVSVVEREFQEVSFSSIIGTTSLSKKKYAGTLEPNLVEGSVVIRVGENDCWFKDDGGGNLVGVGVAGSGSVTYASGVVQISFDSTPPAGLSLMASAKYIAADFIVHALTIPELFQTGIGGSVTTEHSGNCVLGTTSLSQTKYAGTLEPNLVEGSVVIRVGENGGTFRDCGDGTLVGSGVAGSGSVIYGIGVVQITFDSAPASGQSLIVSYKWREAQAETTTTMVFETPPFDEIDMDVNGFRLVKRTTGTDESGE